MSDDGLGGGAAIGAADARPAPLSIIRARLRGVEWPRRRRPDPAGRRLARALRTEELAGLSFAFAARSIAAAAVAAWLVTIVPTPRLYYFLAVVAAFFVLGLVPHLLRRHRYAPAVKLLFIVLDVTLIVAVIVLPPPVEGQPVWPIQMRLRFHEYLYLLLYLAGSALSYSPLHVVWTGLSIVILWSVGFLLIYGRPDTLTFAEATGGRSIPAAESLKVVLDPAFVGISQLWNQVTLTAIMTGLLAAAVWRARRTLLRQTRAEAMRADLARYVSPDVAEAMAARPALDFGAPATREVAVMFADIVGFTAIAEKLPPERVVALLRSFHARACKIVFAHGGTLDKFLGDGFMATFGTLKREEDCARRALACAFALQEEIDRWCAKRAGRGAPAIRIAAGVHHGRVVVGNVGAERRLEFTVVGDPVNVANRLERLTREIGGRIAASREALRSAGGLESLRYPFEAKGPLTLHGREQPVEVFVWPPGAAAAARSASS
jgi:adenylate cyclase